MEHNVDNENVHNNSSDTEYSDSEAIVDDASNENEALPKARLNNFPVSDHQIKKSF